MYGLPKNLDLGFLLGKALQQICVGSHEVILKFDDDLEVTVTSECDYKSKTGQFTRVKEYPASASMICRLLGFSIVKAEGTEDGTLTLRFSNEDTLIIYDDSKQYESYQINYHEHLIVV